jgi:predicted glutamine amidotransferase
MNCHPFAAGRFAFMHNGYIADFARVKRAMTGRLSDAAYGRLRGSTDSEHLFALVQDKLDLEGPEVDVEQLAEALRETITELGEMLAEAEVDDDSRLNLALTDGRSAVVTRFSAGTHEANTLFVHSGSRYVSEDGYCRMEPLDPEEQTVIVASEPLSEDPGWREVPRNHMALVAPDLTVSIRPIHG